MEHDTETFRNGALTVNTDKSVRDEFFIKEFEFGSLFMHT